MDEVPWNKIDIEDTHLTQGSFQENKKITSFCALRRVTAFPHRSLFYPFAVFFNWKNQCDEFKNPNVIKNRFCAASNSKSDFSLWAFLSI